jgi:hypothetical protein
LSTLQALYANVSFSLKFPDGISEEFPSNMGVRQGCPLSPFLLGVYIEMLDEQLLAQLPLCWVKAQFMHSGYLYYCMQMTFAL